MEIRAPLHCPLLKAVAPPQMGERATFAHSRCALGAATIATAAWTRAGRLGIVLQFGIAAHVVLSNFERSRLGPLFSKLSWPPIVGLVPLHLPPKKYVVSVK